MFLPSFPVCYSYQILESRSLSELGQNPGIAEKMASVGKAKRRNSPNSIASLCSEVSNLTMQVSKAENQISQLIGYQANRDKELKNRATIACVEALTTMYQTVDVFPSRTFYYEDGNAAVEWDGVIVCQGLKNAPLGVPNERVYLLEIKQAIDVGQVGQLHPRLQRTRQCIFASSALSTVGNLSVRAKLLAQRALSAVDSKRISIIAGGNKVGYQLANRINQEGFSVIKPSGADFQCSFY